MNTSILFARSSLSIAGVALSCAALALGGCAVATDDQGAEEGSHEVVGEAQQATNVAFPGNVTASLGAGSISNTYEPSGLALHGGVLYMASDNGKIASYNASTNAWTTEISTTADYESLTEASGGQLMVGVEGTSSNNASIAKVNLSTKTIGQSWRLSGVSGMEAMTFVPDAYTPFGAANTAAHPSPFNGYFFIATQGNTGHISAYRLDTASSTGTFIADYAIGISLQASDMSFANGCLYVLFDDHNTTDEIAVFILDTNPSNWDIAFQKAYDLPSVNGSSANYEGITFDGQTIYLGRDDNSNSTADGVYEAANTIIYPQSVLPPLSW